MGNRILRGRIATAVLLAGAALGASAQDQQVSTDANVSPVAARQQAQEIAKGDPARWYRDDPAPQTLRKELGAALQEAQNACRKAPAAERKSCMNEARATWQRETAQLGKPVPRQ